MSIIQKQVQIYEYLKRTRSEISSLDGVAALSKGNKYIKITNCEALNTSHAEYAPVIYNDKLVFTSTRNASMIYEATGTGFADLFLYDYEDEGHCEGTATPFSETINLPEFHEATPTFSADGKTMIFARSNNDDKKDPNKEVNLYESKWNGSHWSEGVLLPSPINHKEHWDGCPFLSADGNTLYFASSRPNGQGGVDIYRATRAKNGKWARVINLGRAINTKGNEMFPYVAADERLYFASDGHPGLGGLDILVAARKDGKTTVKNLEEYLTTLIKMILP